MNIWQFYARVEDLILRLRESGDATAAKTIESALRGGATAGEILGELTLALPLAGDRSPTFIHETNELTAWAEDAIR